MSFRLLEIAVKIAASVTETHHRMGAPDRHAATVINRAGVASMTSSDAPPCSQYVTAFSSLVGEAARRSTGDERRRQSVGRFSRRLVTDVTRRPRSEKCSQDYTEDDSENEV